MEDAKTRLHQVLPLIRVAMEMAKLEVPDGELTLAIAVKKPDGTGKITAHFDGVFLEDVAKVLGVADKPGWMADAEEDDEPGPG